MLTGEKGTHHPGVTASTVHQPAGNLTSGLNDEQGAEAFEQLEDGARVAKDVVPDTEGDSLNEAILAEKVFRPGRRLGLEDATEGAFDPARVASINGKLAEGPDEQRGDHHPLGKAEKGMDGPAKARLFGNGDADARVGKVVDKEGQAVGEARVTATDIKGDWYREDNAEKKDGAE